MKKLLKIVAVLLLLAVAGIAALLAYVFAFKPGIAVEETKITVSTEMLERGRYLAVHVAQCVDCHSERDWSQFAGPVKPGTEGKGGERFDQTLGFPGTYVAPNLTPSNLGKWSDGEVMRAVTAGVSRDGRPLFPVMPYTFYGKMDRADVEAMIAYIRTLKPIESQTETSRSDFPMNIIIRMIPRPPAFGTRPKSDDRVAQGKYLVNVAACVECHTPVNGGRIIEAESFSGGRLFPLPGGGSVISTNITPDESGIGSWSEEKFIETFKRHEQAGSTGSVKQTLMPWKGYAGMTREDLGAIYAYLRSLKPIPSK